MTSRRRADDPDDLDVGPLRGDNGGVELSRRGLRVWGRQAVVLLIVAGLLLLVGGWMYTTRGRFAGADVAPIADMPRARSPESKAEHEAILTALRENTVAMQEMAREVALFAWVTSLPPNQRPRLIQPKGMADRIMRE